MQRVEGLAGTIYGVAALGFTVVIGSLILICPSVWICLMGLAERRSHLLPRLLAGRQISVGLIDLMRVVDGKVVEHWNVGMI